MSHTTVLMLTGNLSVKESGGMGLAATRIAQALSLKTNLLLLKAGHFEPDSVAQVFTINSSATPKKISTIQQLTHTNIEYKSFDFLISPYGMPYKQNNQETLNSYPLLEVIETVAPSYLEEVASYNNKLVELAQTMSFDVIYCHDWTTFQAGISLKLLTKKKLVVHIHSLEQDRKPDNKNPAIYYLERKAMDYADALITVSNYEKERIRKYYEIYPGKIHTVYPAIEPSYIKSSNKSEESKTILFMGRLTRQKGVDQFIKIAEIVHQKFPTAQFVIAGEGELRTELEERIDNSTASDAITMLGFLEEVEKHNLLAISDVFCMPSESEPFGLVAIEAAAAGIPCVLSKQSGVSELLKDSLVANFDDATGFALGIISLLENKSLATSIAADQLNNLQQLNSAQMAEQVLAVLEK